MFDFLLHAIVDRTLILMRAPPDDCEPMGRREVDFERQVFRDSRVDWLNHELAFVSDSPLQILAACLSDFEERYTKISERDWNSHMDLELFEEMDAMQTQFHMMTSFRRFIVLTEKESSLPVKEGGGVSGFVFHFNWNSQPCSWNGSQFPSLNFKMILTRVTR